MAYISAGRAACAAPGRCACDAMARLTGTRPAATRRWGSAAAFLLLLFTVQAGKGGRGAGEGAEGPRAAGSAALAGCRGAARGMMES